MTAREWASRCMFKYKPDLKLTGRTHPNFSFVGENLWTGYTPTLFNAASAIQNWVEEKQDYDYDSNICTNVCGHYKQVCAEIPSSLQLVKITTALPKYKLIWETVVFYFSVSLGCLGNHQQSWLCCLLMPKWSPDHQLCG